MGTFTLRQITNSKEATCSMDKLIKQTETLRSGPPMWAWSSFLWQYWKVYSKCQQSSKKSRIV
jgi:hypothetical protein